MCAIYLSGIIKLINKGFGSDRSAGSPEIGPELTLDYTLDNPFDSSQRSWISWCSDELGFWVAL